MLNVRAQLFIKPGREQWPNLRKKLLFAEELSCIAQILYRSCASLAKVHKTNTPLSPEARGISGGPRSPLARSGEALSAL